MGYTIPRSMMVMFMVLMVIGMTAAPAMAQGTTETDNTDMSAAEISEMLDSHGHDRLATLIDLFPNSFQDFISDVEGIAQSLESLAQASPSARQRTLNLAFNSFVEFLKGNTSSFEFFVNLFLSGFSS